MGSCEAAWWQRNVFSVTGVHMCRRVGGMRECLYTRADSCNIHLVVPTGARLTSAHTYLRCVLRHTGAAALTLCLPPDPSPVNTYLLKLGLPQSVAAAAVNPGFVDPFDAVNDVTLDNPAYRLGPIHLMRGKLDWVLLRGCRVVSKAMGNDAYTASDHKWLMVEVELLL